MVNMQTSDNQDPIDGVAIIGMVGRFPGAGNVDEFWRNLCEGLESTTFFQDEELDPSIDPNLCKDPSYVKARGIIPGGETFDAAFFGINPLEAVVMDPQARVFLELVYEALENAGYESESFEGLIGLYAGCGQNTYFANHISGRMEIVDRIGEFQTMLANEKDFLTTRAAYKLNLKGPAVSVNTACSTSLVAIIQACQALSSYQCDMALAGGVSMTTPQNSGYMAQEGSMLSGDGHCRPFDASAQGTMFNNGAGIVVLKRLEDALNEGDRIYAVIRGSGINNDGADKVSFTAPSVDGQAEAVAMAQAYANFHPETISYIEAHGTATPLGDPIEIEALTQAFRVHTDAKQFCAIGSLKSNVGHLVAAAGVAGLIKTALALHYKKIPPSLNFEAPNPKIDFANSPFYVNTKLAEWSEGETLRRAGVSSFGVGGTNAHIVLEEAPQIQSSGSSRPQQLLLLSAKTSTALEAATANLQQYLQYNAEINLADVAYTLQRGRKALNYRRSIVCHDITDAIASLQSLDPNQVNTRHTEIRNPAVVFMFPGQGSQYVDMGLNLYNREPVFQEVVDECAEILKPLLGRDLREIMYPAPSDAYGGLRLRETAAISLRQTCFTQPALFVIEYALAQLWQSWGVKPQAMIGHSIGELVAACIAGVFTLEDALTLVANRGRLMWELPEGAMLSVRLPAKEVEPRLSAELAIAAINGPSLCVVSGPTEAIAALQKQLESEEVVCRRLHTSHAFHSSMMDSIIAPFAEVVGKVKLSPPQIPFVSTVTADWITAQQATDPMYWATHLRQTVRFAEGVQTLWQQPERILLEVGPRITTTTLARQQAKDIKQQIAIPSLSDNAENEAEWTALLKALGQLWLAGVSIDWSNFYQRETRQRIPLPTYPFERQRFWIDPLPHPNRAATPKPSNPQLEKTQTMTTSPQQKLIPLLKEIIEETSGLEIASVDDSTTFLEMGLDSLSLTQVGLALKKKFQVKVTLRQLLEIYPNLGTLADFINPALSTETLSALGLTETIAEPTPEVPLPAPATTSPTLVVHEVHTNGSAPQISPQPAASNFIENVINQQLQIMSQQLALLGNSSQSVTIPVVPAATSQNNGVKPQNVVSIPSTQTSKESPASVDTESNGAKKAFGAAARIEKTQTKTLTTQQRTHLDKIIQRYTQRTKKSKEYTQSHRPYLADPRTVSGFNPTMKEMVYPIVASRSSGSKLWDVDGNEYVDLSNGFGLNLFGWSPPFITEAIEAQLKLGMEIGPQTPLVGEVAKLMCELTNFDRAAFCNTGSEAVLGAMRMARTITGRNLIAIFSGAYHGILDEVIVRGTKKLRSIPAAPGIPPEMVENILVVDYDSPESLEILRSRADELAAVMVESVQSRRPEYQPKEFLQQLRDFTEEAGIALIFDEIVTGFRIHPGGAQAHFGIKADIATYGKIVGGGLPIGVIAGKSQYMDALDGGFWQFGDDSVPEVGVTYFAGTFVRHPLALAAAKAVLQHLKQSGPSLQQNLNARTDKFVAELMGYFQKVQAPFTAYNFGSLFMVKSAPEFPYGDLLFYLLRDKGVHTWDHRPCFLTTAHSEADLAFVMAAFKESIAEMQSAGFLSAPPIEVTNREVTNNSLRNLPPQPNAKLGRDPQGNPAWYIPDTERPGKYLQVASVS
ncbi:MAG: aminotransferase class III-fold pyridoxal phosphate-dependent enzyme [Nostoc sp. NMS1]|uniref:type I polyketide synthase n=1 Tax=unclassified Nostoc TaxID=2593658 RepID=UPI0025CDAF71|nr:MULTISPECIES: type I polyketide synthase [unclassified Nostoc]MBN3907812.1 aminotransferase class III-fold pyridoxal phosphate-dependent enzyme [Nostoc sp. NMS1]MBN3991177.1 aminotransferase class III-fold pyridoxal phosphate-dependent enzyme [Nostoc sp. NMS2]